jgi:hypothetical protein
LKEGVMTLTPDERTARARLAAHRRWHPNEPPRDPAMAEMEERANQAAIDVVVARMSRMTAAEREEVGHRFRLARPDLFPPGAAT